MAGVIEAGKRAVQLLATMLVVSFRVYLALEADAASVAVKVLGQFSAPDQRAAWLTANHYDNPFLVRYLRWLGRFIVGDWGQSSYYQERIGLLLPPRLAATALLAGVALLVTVPLALIVGIAAGVHAGSSGDRLLSAIAIITTSVPEFAMAALLVGIFVLGRVSARWPMASPGANSCCRSASWFSHRPATSHASPAPA